MTGNADLVKLAQKLVSEGPFKTEPTHRRVRGLFNGKYAFDTTEALYVWEHPYYPQFYIPISGILPSSVTLESLTHVLGISSTHAGAYTARLTVGEQSTDRVLVFHTPQLEDLVRIEFSALDQWFEENVPIYVHPKDPYKRIDILPSSRSIHIALDNVTLAKTSAPILLFETGLRTRYYLPPTSVNWEVLVKSETETYCPYKGKAEYYHVVVGGKETRDAVWYYRYPTAESAGIAGYLCFYDEKVEVWVDGVKQEEG